MGIESGMLGNKAGEYRRQMSSPQISWRADLQQASSGPTSRGDLRFGVAHLLENRATAVIQQQTFIRQPEAPRATVREAHAELGLQGRQAAADRRGRGLQR